MLQLYKLTQKNVCLYVYISIKTHCALLRWK